MRQGVVVNLFAGWTVVDVVVTQDNAVDVSSAATSTVEIAGVVMETSGSLRNKMMMS